MTPALTPIQSIFQDAIRVAVPDTNLTAGEWADTYRVVTQGPFKGEKWRTDRVPGLKEILDSASHVNVKEICVGGCTRWGKTEGVHNNLIGLRIHIDPTEIMMVQPTLDLGLKYSRDRLTALLRDTPVLRGLVEDPRSRDSGNTLFHKIFPGGHISIVGANSPMGLVAEDIAQLHLDEVSRFPKVTGNEGDPVRLAIKRTQNFQMTGEALVVMTSSPTVEGECRISDEYKLSDRCEFWAPCPGCDSWMNLSAPGAFQKMVKWKEINLPTEQARFVCPDPECGAILDEEGRREMLGDYRWVSQAAVAAGAGHLSLWEWYSHEKFNGIAGFWFPGLASTFMTMAQMAEEVTLASRANSLPMKQVFVNATLGETWKPWEEIDKDDLEFRVEDYAAEVPRDVVLMSAAGDVQINRVEIEAAGWAVSEERWSIEYKVFYGDPTRVEAEDQITVWDQVWDYLEREFAHELGLTMNITCAVFDSGGACTDAVYEFTKKAQNPRLWEWRLGRKKRFYWAIKGSSTPGVPIAPKKPSIVGREEVALYVIGTEVAKDRVAAALKTGWSKEGKWVGGAGAYHFPSKYRVDPPDYFEQITSEHAVPSFHRGRPIRRWIVSRSGARNEAWDNLVYNLAAKEISKANLKQYHRLLMDRVARLTSEPGQLTEADEPVTPSPAGDDDDNGGPPPPPRAPSAGPSRMGGFRIPRRRGGRW